MCPMNYRVSKSNTRFVPWCQRVRNITRGVSQGISETNPKNRLFLITDLRSSPECSITCGISSGLSSTEMEIRRIPFRPATPVRSSWTWAHALKEPQKLPAAAASYLCVPTCRLCFRP